MDIRPVDLPEVRADLVSSSGHPHIQSIWKDALAKLGQSTDYASTMARGFTFEAQTAQLYHVSKAMSTLAFAAAQSLDAFVPEPMDAPSRSGIMIFDEPLPDCIRFDDGALITAQGVLWCYWQGTFQFFPLAENGGELSLPLPGAVLPFPHGWCTAPTTASSFRGWDQLEGCAKVIVPAMLATWLLMGQPLARTIEVEADRAAKKRLRRAGYDAKAVRVIELRRPEHSGNGDGSREYHHSWIVRGHWRQQWYPSREVHRPVWIAPHVKGPEGAPLIGGEKVYAWKR